MRSTNQAGDGAVAPGANAVIGTGCPATGWDNGRVTYRITVYGHLDSHWSEWFDGLALGWNGDGDTVLQGEVRDQAALYGLLIKLRDLGLSLCSVIRLE